MNKIILALGIMAELAGSCYAQEKTSIDSKKWKIQPIHMPTRWAKEVNPFNTLKDYPRPQMVRNNWENLNGLWQYAITQKDTPIPSQYDGQILVPYPIESALSGVKKGILPSQNLWYKRIIANPHLQNGERLLLNFGAIDWEATVYVNGKEIGDHKGGYQNFSFDITDALIGDNNELLIKVYDPTDQGPNPHGKQTLNPGNIYYTPSSGIWQTVWTERVSEKHISNIKTTPDIDKELLTLLVNTTEKGQDLTVKVEAKTGDKVISIGQGKPGTNIQLSIPKPRLWSPSTPFLYDLSIKLIEGTKTIDEISSYFAMRKIDIQKDNKGIYRIYLNNKYTYNLGTLDQGFWPEGLMTAPTDEALAFDIKAIKSMGFNTIRKHIKVEPDRWYYHADKIGILVWQDLVNPPHSLPNGSKPIFEKEAKETIEQLYNHPSVISWVLFNEQWGSFDQKRLTNAIRNIDPTRIINAHSGELLYIEGHLVKKTDTPWVDSDVTDIHSYPDPMNAPNLQGKAMILGEFGGIGVSVPGHQWTDLQGWGYVQLAPSEMKTRYLAMTNKLKKLETEGLSGSIYTQPFDVEGEENGLLTYDREIIKIPFDQIRKINQTLLQTITTLPKSDYVIAKNIDTADTDNRYKLFLTHFNNGKRDSAFLRRLVLMSIRKKDTTYTTKIGNIYISQLSDIFNKGNLEFIRHITRSSNDTGFKVFTLFPDKVNAILGKNQAEDKLRAIIAKEEITPYTSNVKVPDWNAITQRVTTKFGAIGEETVWGQQMVYYWEKQDWNALAKYYVLYYQRALDRSEYDINNLSWFIFLHVEDIKVLEFAAEVCKYNIEKFDSAWESCDTYANILYKLGRTKEAISWEEKAVKLSNNVDVVMQTLEKMKKGQPTWAVRLSGSN